MSKASKASSKVIESVDDLVQIFKNSETHPDRLLVGDEFERPPYYLDTKEPVPYEGIDGRAGLRQFFEALVGRGWEPVYEGEYLIGLSKEGVNYSLEPGGQVETGGAPKRNLHEIAAEMKTVVAEATEVGESLGIGFLAMGYHPTHTGEALPMMPLLRFAAWRKLNETRSRNGMAGQSCTSTAQVSVDYISEEHMKKVMRVATALQPVMAALCANSPFCDGKPSEHQSYRSHILHEELQGRCAFIPHVVFEEDFGYQKYIEYIIDFQVLGIYRDGVFVDVSDKEMTFADFMQKGIDGHRATTADFLDFLGTIWPVVRLRREIEMRGADNLPPELVEACTAAWVGLCYDMEALDAADQMISDWTKEDREYLLTVAPQDLQASLPSMGTTVLEIAKNFLALSDAGLKRRDVKDENGKDESIYLAPLHEIANSGKNWAMRLVEKFYGKWKGDIGKLYKEMDYASSPSVLKRDLGDRPGHTRAFHAKPAN